MTSGGLNLNNKMFSNSLTVPGFDVPSDDDSLEEGKSHANGLLVICFAHKRSTLMLLTKTRPKLFTYSLKPKASPGSCFMYY